jgi:hypothetical protein
MGEKAGHPFRGNQYGSSKGKGGGTGVPHTKIGPQGELVLDKKAKLAGDVDRAMALQHALRASSTYQRQVGTYQRQVGSLDIDENTRQWNKSRSTPVHPKPKTGNFQPKDVGATGARIVINPQTGKREIEVKPTAAERAARREIQRRPALQGFSGGPSENVVRMVQANRKYRAEELKKTRASAKERWSAKRARAVLSESGKGLTLEYGRLSDGVKSAPANMDSLDALREQVRKWGRGK